MAASELGLSWDGIEQDVETAKIAAERLRQRIRLFADTVVRRMPGDSQVYLMNRQRGGWGQRAMQFRSVDEIQVFFDVLVGEWATDEHGEYAPAVLQDAA